MSIIEKMVDRLGWVPQPNRKPLAADMGAGTFAPDLIERAANNRHRRADFPEDQEFAPDAAAEPKPARAIGGSSRMVRVDLDKLRRQNMITPDGERTPIAEGFRRVKRRILAKVASPGAGGATNLVMVTSPLAGEGKTFCAINLAISIAMEMERTVLLVDADVANPSVPRVLGVEMERGLLDVLLDRRIDLAEVLCKTNIDKLTILPAGTRHQHATELLASDTMRELLQEMAERYHDRIIIFDSAPLLAASEAGVLASHMAQIVMVVEAGKTTEAVLKDALNRIESCNTVGLLLNKGTPPGSGYFGYGYGYGYGA